MKIPLIRAKSIRSMPRDCKEAIVVGGHFAAILRNVHNHHLRKLGYVGSYLVL